MTRTLALLALAMLVQGFALFFLVPALPGHWLAAYGLLCAGAFGWALSLQRRADAAMESWAARLSALSPAAGVTGATGATDPPMAGQSELAGAVHRLEQRLSDTLAQTRALRGRSEEAGVYRTAFLRAVAHELRTPLNAILGFTDILLSGLEGPVSDDRRENLEVIGHSGRKLLSLFNDAIELSAMASGQLSLRREEIDLAELLDAAVEQVARARGVRPVHVTSDVTAGAARVHGQRDRLLRVLDILGQAALERTAAGQIVFQLQVSEQGETVSICVVDSGDAYVGRERESIFTPELATTPDGRRVGLRLAIARQLAELHGGHLLLADGGVRFRLELPSLAQPEVRDGL